MLHHLHSWSQQQGRRMSQTFTQSKSPEFTQAGWKWIDFSPSLVWFGLKSKEASGSCLCVHSKNMWSTGEYGRRSFISDLVVIFNSSPMCRANQNMFLIRWARKYLFMQLTLMWQMKRSVTPRGFTSKELGLKRGQAYLCFWGEFLIWTVFLYYFILFDSQTSFSAFSSNRCGH